MSTPSYQHEMSVEAFFWMGFRRRDEYGPYTGLLSEPPLQKGDAYLHLYR